MAGISEQLRKIDQLSLRERGILLAGGLILVLIIWFNFFYEPLQEQKEALRLGLEQQRNEVQALALQLRVLEQKKQPDPNEQNRQRREQLRTDIESSKLAIMEATVNLVPPQRMPEVLKSVLAGIPGLQLVKLKGLGRTPLIPDPPEIKDQPQAAASDAEQDFATPYRHGMQIVFEGDFLTTVEYMKKLEGLEWRFFWDTIELKVEEYPRAISSVTLYTLSLDQDWIGI